MASHLASLWKWDVLELGNGLFWCEIILVISNRTDQFWNHAYDFRSNCVPNCAPLSSIAIDYNLPVKFRIGYTIAVIFFKAIHNLGSMYSSNLININDVLAVTCGVMWADDPTAKFNCTLRGQIIDCSCSKDMERFTWVSKEREWFC